MKQFLPFLTDDQGRSLDVENGVVLPRSVPTPLENSPDGWEKNTVQFARNSEFRGIIKSYTTSLKFYLNAATILRNAFYRTGMETVLFFIWLKLDQSFGGNLAHKAWYKGEPDFGTFKDEYDGVEIAVTEGGFYKDLQANKAVMQEIKFDTGAVSLYTDGINLRQKLNYSDLEDFEVAFSYIGDRFFGPYSFVGQDGASTGFISQSEEFEHISGSFESALTSQNFILKNFGPPTTITISGRIEFNCTAMDSSPAYGIRFRYLRSNQLIANQNDYQVIATGAMVVGQLYTQDFSVTIPLNTNESLFREGIFFGGVGSEAVIKFTANSLSNIAFITRQKPAVILAKRAFTLGNDLTDKVSPGATLTSPLLEPNFNLLVTSGDAIRALPDAVIKTSFSDWYKSVDAVLCTEMDVVDNNPVVFDRYERWVKDRQIAQLGEVSKWSLEPADEYIYDSVEVGYPSKTADSNIDVNGKYSFNNGYTWKLNKTRRKVNAYQAKSVYFADPYDIALIRVNLENKVTTTGQTDNSVFFIDAEPKTDISFTGTIHYYASDNKIELDGDVADITPFIIVGAKVEIAGTVWTVKSIVDVDVLDIIFVAAELITTSVDTTGTANIVNLYHLRRPEFTFEGIPQDNSVFNIMLSPRRILERHLRWLRSSCDHLDGQKFVLQTTEKNRALKTTDTLGAVVDEDADIPVALMGEKVYLPYYITFEVQSPYNLIELMAAGAGGKFDLLRSGQPMDGFPMEVATEEVHLETQTYKLLQTANNDNLTLINGR